MGSFKLLFACIACTLMGILTAKFVGAGLALGACVLTGILLGMLVFLRRKRRRTRVVPQQRKRGVALHEAAHAVADAVEFGAEVVVEMCVHAMTNEEDDHYGYVMTRFTEHGFAVTLDVVRRRARSVLAGRAADEIFLGAPHSGSADDLETANEMLFAAYAQCGFAGQLVTYPNDHFDPPDEMRSWMERELRDAYADARRLVTANSAVIEALAGRILDEPIDDGRHVLSAEAIEKFFEAHPTTPLGPFP